MRRTHWKAFLAAVLTGLAVLAGGCGDDEGTGLPPIQTPPDDISTVPVAELRVIHAVPDLPPVDIYLQGRPEPLATHVTYGAVTGYINVDPGSPILEFRPAGASPGSPPLLLSDPLTLIPAAQVTAIATGLVDPLEPESAFRVLPLIEDFGQASPDTARVRIVHAGVDAPPVDIDVGNDGSIEVEDLERFEATGAAGVEVPAGTALQLGVLSGETGQPLTAFSVPPLPVGTELFIVPTGLTAQAPRDPQGFALLTVSREGRLGLIRQNPVVYALHASPDAPAVDLFSAGDELVDALRFGELSAPIQVPPGEYALNFFGHQPGPALPSGAPAARGQTPALEAGQRYLLVASGFLLPVGREQEFSLLAYREEFERAGESVRLRLVHASPDAPPVDAGALTGNGLVPEDPLFQDLIYSEASRPEGEPLQPASITLGVAPAPPTAQEPVASFALDLSPFQGARLFGVAAGALRPREGAEGFRLLLVNTSQQPWAVQQVLPR